MDNIKNIFSKKKKNKKSSNNEESEEGSGVPVIEVTESQESRQIGEIEPIVVRSFDLNSSVDVKDVTDQLEQGNIAIINISPLMDEDPAELKQAVNQLKRATRELGGDVGRLSESRIIATPQLVRIEFKGKRR